MRAATHLNERNNPFVLPGDDRPHDVDRPLPDGSGAARALAQRPLDLVRRLCSKARPSHVDAPGSASSRKRRLRLPRRADDRGGDRPAAPDALGRGPAAGSRCASSGRPPARPVVRSWSETTARFALQGRGTPAPWAPPERFVERGSYRFVRSPMYLGVILLILGQALLLGPRDPLRVGRRGVADLRGVARDLGGAAAAPPLRRVVRRLPAARPPLAPTRPRSPRY